MEAMGKMFEDLGDVLRRHNSKILNWQVNKLKGNNNGKTTY